VRNLFDQYEQHENRVTHALACCLHEDPTLLRRFVRWAIGRVPDGGQLRIVQQQVPGEPRAADDDAKGALPDAWIFGPWHWSLLIESKVGSAVGADQLARHRRVCRDCGFKNCRVLVLSPRRWRGSLDGVIHRPWSDLYAWAAREAARSMWARRLREYMEIAEDRMVAEQVMPEGTLTRFAGFCFDPEHPYTYGEAKRCLRLAIEKLRDRSDLRTLGADRHTPGRPAITGSGSTSVWDFIPLMAARRAKNFVRHPHLTLSVSADHVAPFVTLPSGAESRYWRSLRRLGPDGFLDLVSELCRAMAPVVRTHRRASPHMYALQRHYPSQRAQPVTDARVDFDLRTAMRSRASRVKLQPEWVAAVFNAIAHKKSNLQLGVGIQLPYTNGTLATPDAVDLIASCWMSCRPFLKALKAAGTRA
jgi:hypothetical protein